MKNKHTFTVVYTVILTLATVWSLLATFVIADEIAVVDATLANTDIYAELENEYAASDDVDSNVFEETPSVSDATVVEEDVDVDEDIVDSEADSILVDESENISEPIITDTSYQDDNIQISIDLIREYDTNIYIADVVISDIAYLKTALAENTYGRNIKDTTSEIAEEHNAILAINGDYYGFRDAGFVIRNGVLYRTTAQSESSEALVVHADGSFEIVTEASADAQALYDAGALQVLSFGPGLIEDGAIIVDDDLEDSRFTSSNPRTAIGMIDELHYIFVVTDGRTGDSEGLTLLELAEVMQTYGCTVAYNLDGGGSSTMVFNGEVVNTPTSGRSSGERSISDIVYIGEYL